MKRISLDEAKRNLKRVLKNKISINEKTVITYLMMGMIGLFSSTAVMAAAVTQGTGAQASDTGVALGASFQAWNGAQNGAQANSEGAIAIGGASVANTGKQSIAIGQSSKTTATQAIAIGGDVLASGVASIALGGDDAEGTPYANSKYNSTTGKVETAGSIQYQSTTASGAGSVSIGVKSQATADGTSALGVLATATGKEATALGAMSASKGERAVALGAGSIASGTKAFAAGDGSQATAKETIAIGSGSKASTDNAFAIGVGAQSTHANTIAMGTRAEALANSAVAIGNKAKSTGQDSVAFGTLSRTINSGAYASGIAARAVGKESVAIGWMTSTGTGNATYDDDKSTGVAHVAANSGDGDGKGEYSVSIGSNMAVTGSNSIGIGKAGNKAVASVSGDNSISLGNGNKIESNKVVAVGNSINIATGKEGAVALGDATSVTQAGGVALGNGSAATTAAGATGYDITGGTNTGKTWVSTGAAVSVGNATTTRQITNVAAGTEDTDAVNVAQLKKAKVNVVAGENVTVTPQVTADGTTYTISSKAKKTEVAAENGLTVAETAIDGGTRYTVKLDDATKRKIDNLNADELNAVKDKVNNQGITFKGNTTTTTTKKLGETLNVVGDHTGTEVSAKNIKTEVLTNGDLKIQMTERPDFKSTTIGVDGSAKTTIGDAGISVTDGAKTVKLQPTGLDNGGNKIVNVAAGTTDTDAVNYSQLKKLENTLGLAVDANGNLTPLAKKLRDEQGNEITNGNMTTLVNNTADRVNAGLVYGGDTNAPQALTADPTDTSNRQQLGSTFEVKSATEVLTSNATGKTGENFVGDNLTTKYVRKADGSGILSIGMTEKPNFKEVTVEDPAKPGKTTTLTPEGTTVKDTATNKETTYGVDGLSIKGADGQTTTLGRDADGNLTVTNGKDGQGAKALATKDDVNKVTDALGLPKNVDGTIANLDIPAVKGSDSKNPDGTTKAPTTILEAVKDTATAINKGISLSGNDYDAATDTTVINKKLGERFEVVGTLANDKDASSKNIRTTVNGGKLEILMAEKPEFAEISIKDPAADPADKTATVIGKDGISIKGKDGNDAISLTNKTENGETKPSLEFADNKGAVKGLEDRKATDSRVTDYGTGANANRAATEGALKDLADKLGIDNSTPTPLDTKQLATPAGKDGLTGANGQPKSYKDQINALRDGTAGNTVYTDSNGNRLKKANNGNYYLADQVDENGNVKEANPPITPATDVMISNVNTDGSTTAPIKTGNIASGLGLDSTEAGNNTALTPEQAKDALNGKDGKPGLLAQTGNSLNNAATVKDLQALAQAGLDFTGNNNTEKTLHRPLGSKLVVEGETSTAKNNTNITKQAFGATAADNIHVEAKVDGDTNKLVVSLTEDLKNINSLTTKPHDNGDGTQTTTKLTPEGTKVSKVKPSADPATPAEEVESANYGLNTEMTKTAADGTKTTSVSSADGNTMLEEKPDGTVTKSEETAAGTTLEQRLPDGKVKNAEYTVDGNKVSEKAADGTSKETVTNAGGTTVVEKDANDIPTKSAEYTADGSKVTAYDPATGNPKAESKYGADGLSTKALDPATGKVTGETTVTPTGVNLYGKDGKDGKDGKPGEPVASLTNNVDAAGNNNPTLSFAKEPVTENGAPKTDEYGNPVEKGTGSITGLKDLERNPDGTAKDKTAAANAGYVDDRIAAADAGKPFEYFEKDADGNVKVDPVTGEAAKLERGRDGKFYPAGYLKDKTYDPTTNTYKDVNGTPIPTDKVVDSNNITVQAMPSPTGKPIEMGNVGSGLVLDDSKEGNAKPLTADQAKEAMNGKDGKPGLLAKTGDSLNNVATVKDLQALAQAGLDFTGNNAAETTLHRPLGSKLVVEGETDKTDVTKATFGATAKDNIHVEAKEVADGDKKINKLVVSLSEDLKGINSLTTKPVKNADGTETTTKLTSEGTKVSKVKPAVVDPATGTVTTPAEEVESANYGLNTEMKKTAEDGTVTTSTSNAGGTVLTEKTPDGKETISVETVGGTSISEKDAAGNETRAAKYDLDGTKVTSKDPATGITKETTTGVDGTNVALKDANNPNNDKSSNYGVDGTELRAKDEQGNPIAADYKVDGATVVAKDPVTGETKETTLKPDGTYATIKDAAGNPTKSSNYTADGSTVKNIDPVTGKPTTESKYGADGLSTKALDPNTGEVTGETTVTPTGVNLYGKDGKDGKDAQPIASLTNTVDADGNNNPTLSFAKDEAGNGTGSITGLKDLETNPDGTAKDRTAAVNAGYVDDKIGALDSKLNNTKKDLSGGIAGAVAMANLPQVRDIAPHKHNIAAAYGHYGSQHALALGISGISDNERAIYKASVALDSRGKTAFGVGVGYQIDAREDLYGENIIDRLNKLNAENIGMKRENEEFRGVINKLLQDVENLKKNQK